MFISESIHEYARDVLDFENNFYDFCGNEPSKYILIYNKETDHVVDIFPSDHECEAKALVSALADISGNPVYDYEIVNLTKILRFQRMYNKILG